MTLREYIETFYEPQIITPMARWGTQREIRTAIEKYILPLFGDKELESLRKADWLAFTNHLRLKAKLADKTIRNHQSVLRRLMSVAVEYDYLDNFPNIKSVKLVLPDMRWLTASEQNTLTWAGSLEREQRWYAMLQIALNTGMRIGELRALRWASIIHRDDKSYFYVDKSFSGRKNEIGPTKGAPREIAVNVASSRILKDLRDITGSCAFVFSNPKVPLAPPTYKACDVAVKRIAKRAKLRDVGWHTLRHTVATALANNPAVTIVQVQQLLGHVDLKTTQRYVHVDRTGLVATTAALDAVELGLVNRHF